MAASPRPVSWRWRPENPLATSPRRSACAAARSRGRCRARRAGRRPPTASSAGPARRGAADRGGPLAGALFRRLFVMTAQLHLAIDALTLQLLLERAQRLVDIIVANDDLHKAVSLQSTASTGKPDEPTCGREKGSPRSQ